MALLFTLVGGLRDSTADGGECDEQREVRRAFREERGEAFDRPQRVGLRVGQPTVY